MRLDHHAAAHVAVLGQVGLQHQVIVPLGVVRAAMAVAAEQQAPQEPSAPSAEQDYYDPEVARSTPYRDYYDLAYNDPYYYNYGRFGFGASVGSFGPGMGMGLSYGWPGYYDPFNYGMGFGYSPFYSYYPSGYYPYGVPGYVIYDQGYGPYQGPYGGCVNCYEPIGYSVYGHRGSMASVGGAGSTTTNTPRRMRSPVPLLTSTPAMRDAYRDPQRPTSSDRITVPGRDRTVRNQAPARNWDSPSQTPTRNGNDMGGGRTYSPRPR
jgi:hypothetical protein